MLAFFDGRYRTRICDLHDVNVPAPEKADTNNTANNVAVHVGADHPDRSRHQWRHQHEESDERSVVALLTNVVAETPGTDAAEQVAAAIRARIESSWLLTMQDRDATRPDANNRDSSGNDVTRHDANARDTTTHDHR